MNRISYHFIYLHLVLPYRVYAYGLVISSILAGGATLQVICRLQRFCYLNMPAENYTLTVSRPTP